MKSSPPAALIIDDEIQIRRLLRLALEAKGYRVSEAGSGQQGLGEAALGRPDVVLLDLGLPDLDGAEVLRRLREWSSVPVVVLSVRDGAEDKIGALEAGADDYVQKPFDSGELIARLNAVRRRAQAGGEDLPLVQVGDLSVDVAAHEVVAAGKAVKLTPTEFAMLRILARHAGKVVTQRHLLREVWGPKAEEQGQYLRVHMTHLRKKLAAAGMTRAAIQTETGIGFRLVEG